MLTVVAAATLPYLSLLAANVGEVLELDRVFAWWGATLAAALVLLGLVALAGRRHLRWAGAFTGVALYLFFQYRPLAGLGEFVGSQLSPLQSWGLVAAVVLAVAIPLTRTSPVQVFLSIWLPALLLLPAVQLVTASPASADPGGPGGVDPAVALAHEPNVYWIVLDGQAGPPFLRDELGLDPEPFLDSLRGRGFDVQERATSNYPLTYLAIASALEWEYLYEGIDEPRTRPFLERLRGHNRTVDALLANGYGYVHAFPGLWRGSRCSGREDVCLGEHGTLGDTEWALISATPLVEVLVDEDAARDIAATNDPLQVVEAVLDGAPPSPYFAFIHQLNPHPPYLRDAACQLRDASLEIADWGTGREYRDAVTCLFDRLDAAVDRILAVDEDPVIVIQGDHGPRLGLDSETTGVRLLGDDMHFSALSAIRLPDACADVDIPDDLTLVNTFRIVFACLQNAAPDLLPDRHFPIRREY